MSSKQLGRYFLWRMPCRIKRLRRRFPGRSREGMTKSLGKAAEDEKAPLTRSATRKEEPHKRSISKNEQSAKTCSAISIVAHSGSQHRQPSSATSSSTKSMVSSVDHQANTGRPNKSVPTTKPKASKQAQPQARPVQPLPETLRTVRRTAILTGSFPPDRAASSSSTPAAPPHTQPRRSSALPSSSSTRGTLGRCCSPTTFSVSSASASTVLSTAKSEPGREPATASSTLNSVPARIDDDDEPALSFAKLDQ